MRSMGNEANYTIPSDNRELQLGIQQYPVVKIIPYQVITGNYNQIVGNRSDRHIIPYQVITGNYNLRFMRNSCGCIIPYQVITGNYNPAPVET